jgi:hypothetical protein
MLKKLLSRLVLAATIAFPYTHYGYAAELGDTPQTSDERGIKVNVLLQYIRAEAKTWDFEVTLESHTQSLNDDLVRSSVLVADGKQYLPLGWKGSPPGGHHRKGLLRFKVVAPRPQSVELQIRLAGEKAPRTFSWALQK